MNYLPPGFLSNDFLFIALRAINVLGVLKLGLSFLFCFEE